MLHFASSNVCSSYVFNNFDVGIFFFCFFLRHVLAALHFNYNLQRDDKVNDAYIVPLKVSYPKFKNGEATVRSRKVEQKFG